MSVLLRNITWLGAANAVAKPLWFAYITAMCMRILGVDGYGIMMAALALSSVGASFMDLGMARHTVREVAKDRSLASLHYTNLITLRMAIGVAAPVIVLVVAYVLDYRGEAFLAVVFACVYTTFLNLVNYCRSYFEAFEDLRREGILLVAEKALVVGLGSAALIATRAPHWTLAGMAAGMALTFFANTSWIGRHFARFRASLFSREFLLRTLRLMVPLGLGGLFFSLYFRVDLVLLEALLSEREAGQFGVVYRIIEAMSMIPALIVISALYPRLSSLLGARRYAEFSRLVYGGHAALGLLTVAVAVIFTTWGADIVHLLDPTPGFDAAGPALGVVGWTLPALALSGLAYSALIALNDDRGTAAMLGVGILLNLVLDFWLIPLHGVMGAALVTVVVQALLLIAFLVRYHVIWKAMSRAADRVEPVLAVEIQPPHVDTP